MKKTILLLFLLTGCHAAQPVDTPQEKTDHLVAADAVGMSEFGYELVLLDALY